MKKLNTLLITIAISMAFTTTLFSQTFWENLNGPKEGWTFEMFKTSQGTYLAGAHMVIMRSTNQGDSWYVSSQTFSQDVTAWDFYQMPSNSTIFAAMNIDKVYASTDDGVTWRDSSEGIQHYVSKIAGNGTVLLAFSHGGVYRSTNNADSWTLANGDLLTSGIFNQQKNAFYAIRYDAVVKSTDLGSTWSVISPTAVWQDICFSPDGTTLYAADKYGRVKYTPDDGMTWLQLGGDFPHEYIMQIYCASNGTLFIGTENKSDYLKGNVYKYSGTSAAWVNTTADCYPAWVQDISELDGNIFFCSYHIYKSTDSGDSWGITGYSFTQVTALASTLSPRLLAHEYYCVTTNPIKKWLVMGENSMHLANASSYYVSPSNIIYATSRSEHGVFKSTNDGRDWVMNKTGLDPFPVLSVIGIDEATLLTAQGDWITTKVYRSADSGFSWTASSTGLPDTLQIKKLVRNPVNGTIVAITGDKGVFRSTNNGTAWSAATSPNQNVTSVYFTKNGTLFAGFITAGLMKSTDDGTTWTNTSTGLNSPVIQSIVENQDGQLFCTTPSTVYRSSNSGTTWESIQYNLPLSITLLLAVDSKGYLYVSGDLGVFKSMAPTGIGSESDIPATYTLNQNFPNPFNPTTSISFTLSARQHIEVSVYDLLGRKVATLFQGIADAGTHQVDFDAGGLSSGVYFYELRSKSGTLRNKMVLIR